MNEQLSASEIVKRARNDNKITGMEIIQNIFPDFVELRGDRAGGMILQSLVESLLSISKQLPSLPLIEEKQQKKKS